MTHPESHKHVKVISDSWWYAVTFRGFFTRSLRLDDNQVLNIDGDYDCAKYKYEDESVG